MPAVKRRLKRKMPAGRPPERPTAQAAGARAASQGPRGRVNAPPGGRGVEWLPCPSGSARGLSAGCAMLAERRLRRRVGRGGTSVPGCCFSPWRCWRLESKANLGLILSLRRTATWPPTPDLLPRVKTEMSPDIPQVSARRQNRPRLRLSAEPAVDTGLSPQIRDPGLEGLGALP